MAISAENEIGEPSSNSGQDCLTLLLLKLLVKAWIYLSYIMGKIGGLTEFSSLGKLPV